MTQTNIGSKDPIFSTVQLPQRSQRDDESTATLTVSNTVVNEALQSGTVPKSLLRRPIHLSCGPDRGHMGVFRLQSIGDSHPLSLQSSIAMEVHSNPLYTISDGTTIPMTTSSSSSSSAINNDHHRHPPPHRHHHYLQHNNNNYNNNNNNNNNQNIRGARSQHSLRSEMDNDYSQFPDDHFNLLFMSFVLAGMSYLVPYNAYMATFDYFTDHLHSNQILYEMSAIYIFCALLTAAILSAFLVEQTSLLYRLHVGQFLTLGTMFFITFIEIFRSFDTIQLDLTIVSLASIGCSLQQTAFYGLTAMLERRYSNAVMWGEACAGIFVGFVNIVTRIMFPDNLSASTVILFIISSSLMAFTCFVHLSWVPKHSLVRFYLQRSTQDAQPNTSLHRRYLNHPFLSLVFNDNIWFWQRRADNHPNNNGSSSNGNNTNDRISTPHATNADILDNDESRMMQEINENLIRVQQYARQDEQRQGSSYIDSGDTISNGSIELCPSFSDSNQRVQRLLRTDSNEQIDVFGIDEEEVQHEIQRDAAIVARSRSFRNDDRLEAVQLDRSDSIADVSVTSTANDLRVHQSRYIRIKSCLLSFCWRICDFVRQLFHRICKPNSRDINAKLCKAFRIRRLIVTRIWQHMLSCFFVYTVTMILFPAVDSEISSCFFEPWVGSFMLPVFYVSDLLGRVTNRRYFHIQKNTLLGLSFVRIFILALFSLFLGPNDGSKTSAIWYLGSTAVLGWSNGLLGSLAIVLAPIEVTRDMREIVGNIMSLCSFIGLACGALFAFFVHNWIQGMIFKFGWRIICPFVPNSYLNVSQHLIELSNITTNLTTLHFE